MYASLHDAIKTTQCRPYNILAQNVQPESINEKTIRKISIWEYSIIKWPGFFKNISYDIENKMRGSTRLKDTKETLKLNIKCLILYSES